MVTVSQGGGVTVSATLAVNEETDRRRRAGLRTVPLGFGEAGLPVHPLLTRALTDAAPQAGYGPVRGIDELRVAAAGYWSRRGLSTDADQVIAGPGSKALLYALLHTVRGALALPLPSWVSYAAQAALLGLPTRPIPGFGAPDPDLLDAAARRGEIGAVLVTLPDNPTGTLATSEVIRAVAEVARRHDLLIISDEIYRDLLHDPAMSFTSPADIAPERTVITTGLSKNLALGGWRLGVARFPVAARELQDRVAMIASEIWSAPARPVQQAAAVAFGEPEPLRERIAASARLHGVVANAVADEFRATGATVPRPHGGFYLYPDFRDVTPTHTDVELAHTLLHDHGIATLPGSAFGDDPAALRLRIATSQLYGTTDAQRATALTHPNPTELPWLAAHLTELRHALNAITSRSVRNR